MIIAGIDPGLSGGVALLDTGGPAGCQVWDMPAHALTRGGKKKREIDPHRFAALIGDNRVEHAFIEQAWAMPAKGPHAQGKGQGASSAFATGKGYGVLIGALAALRVPYTIVSSMKWKRALAVPAAKDGARSRASQLLPNAEHQWQLVKHDGRAEAALLALYGSREIAGNRVELPAPREARSRGDRVLDTDPFAGVTAK